MHLNVPVSLHKLKLRAAVSSISVCLFVHLCQTMTITHCCGGVEKTILGQRDKESPKKESHCVAKEHDTLWEATGTSFYHAKQKTSPNGEGRGGRERRNSEKVSTSQSTETRSVVGRRFDNFIFVLLFGGLINCMRFDNLVLVLLSKCVLQVESCHSTDVFNRVNWNLHQTKANKPRTGKSSKHTLPTTPEHLTVCK